MRVSVVVPTYEGLDTLPDTVSAVRNGTYDDLELVVVDDGSGPEQRDYLRDLRERADDVTVVFQENSGPAAARNRGWREADGEVIAFTDDDCRPPPDWVERLVDVYEQYPDVAGVGGYLGPSEELAAENVFARYHAFVNRAVYDMPEDEVRVGGAELPVGGTGNMSYRRETLAEVGGFDEGFPMAAGEDADLQERVADAGHRLALVPVRVDHVQTYDWNQFVEESIRRGRGVYHFHRKHGGARHPLRIAFGLVAAPASGLGAVTDTRSPGLLALSVVSRACNRYGELREWWDHR